MNGQYARLLGGGGVSRCCEAVLSREEKERNRALASLRRDPGLQQLLPHLSTFVQTKVRTGTRETTIPLNVFVGKLNRFLDLFHRLNRGVGNWSPSFIQSFKNRDVAET